MKKKLLPLLQWCDCESIDITFLQETGLRSHDYSLLNRFSRVMYMNGIDHTGVAIIIKKDLEIMVEREWRSPCGRAIAILLTLPTGFNLFIASLYLPTGLDNTSLVSDAATEAISFYNLVFQWIKQFPQNTEQLICGDLNETFSTLIVILFLVHLLLALHLLCLLRVTVISIVHSFLLVLVSHVLHQQPMVRHHLALTICSIALVILILY